MPKSNRKNSDLRLKLPADFEAAMKALLATPPPPVGHPATRKKAPNESAKKRQKDGDR
jgi:hypothetical protein